VEKRFKFTKKKLNNLSLPEKGKRVEYHDTQVLTLKLRVTSAGSKTFSVYRRLNGVPERFTIGKYPTMTIEQARSEAEKINILISKGVNPNDAKRADRAELTLSDLYSEYIENHAKQYKKSWRSDENNYKNHLSNWGSRKLSRITKKDVQGLHRKLGKHAGKYQANRVLSLLKIMFNKAIEWEVFAKLNPTNGIKKFPEKSRERFLQADELQAFFESVANEENETIRDYVLISLLTGARRANVLAMKWEEISIDRREWRIPETKNGTPHTIPLTKEALKILEDRNQVSSSPFVFAGRGKSGHLVEPKKGWERIKDRAGIKDLRLHDLRRSLGSWQAATGASLPIIGKTLAHKNVSTTAIYARLNTDPVRESMEKATSAMLSAGKKKAEVIPIKKKA
jgi:integrase